MAIWALADLHLSFGVPGKEMDLFGEKWANHADKIRSHWVKNIAQEDLVLLPGDISWAMRQEDALADLKWIDTLPGTKVMIRGNHDYWWNSLSKLEKIMPPSIHLIQNNVFVWNDIVIAGARLWDTPEYSFHPFIDFKENPKAKKLTDVDPPTEVEKIFLRELSRLELSLKAIPRDVSSRIAMTHYPPIGADLQPSRASALLEKYGVNACVFGHLHNVKPNALPFGTKNNVKYVLVSADYIDFNPVRIL